jgi:hypothetical protein
MSEILKRTSFGLIRTNPKLTTNIKIIADSNNRVLLESIDADPLLSKSIYKGFEVTGGSYSNDIYRFYNQGSTPLPKSIAYTVYEKDLSLQIKDRYQDQYDFTYCMGMQPKNSRLYPEEFSLFSPLWIEKDNIPDYFVIFKLDGPVSIDYSAELENDSTLNLDNSTYLDGLIKSPANFFENYIKKAKIIKTFDLSNKTNIGKYIRNHVEDPLFPESSIYASIEKNDFSYWQGVSYDAGGFCEMAQDIYIDYVLVDKTITESDDFLTLGFQNNGVVHPNILNLEFLFDDINQEEFKFSRYFGFYVSEAELGKFEIDGSRLFQDKNFEDKQIPTPSIDNFGYSNNTLPQVQSNINGIKIYPKLNAGGTGIYEGRLITWEETQNPRFPYVKDVQNNLYSINSSIGWTSTYATSGSTSYDDGKFLRIKDTTVDWNNFTDFGDPLKYIKAKSTQFKGRPNFSFKITGDISIGDQIRISKVNWNDPNEVDLIDYFTVIADNSLIAGQNNANLFSLNGTPDQIATAISKAINNINVYNNEHITFESMAFGDTVIVYSRMASESWNRSKFSFFSTSIIYPFSKPNIFIDYVEQLYLPSPVSQSTLTLGKYYEYHFVNGCDNPNARFIIDADDFQELYDNADPIYTRTDKGYGLISDYSVYLEEPVYNELGEILNFLNWDKYISYNISETNDNVMFTSSGQIPIYQSAKNSNGYLSIYPIRDFDFDFLSTEYSKTADSTYPSLYDWYLGITGPDGSTPTFNYTDFGIGITGATSRNYIDTLLGPASAFSISNGFNDLSGLSDEFFDENIKIVNEYDRLKENVLSEIALSSRVVPFINKWVYDNESVDVRENGYRLNSDQSFGYSNFSPSFDEINKNVKFYTHEWYYLQKYPPYMSFDEKKSSFSYFDEDLYFPILPPIGSTGSSEIYLGLTGGIGASANLLSINTDYFLSYFTRETIDGIAIPRDFKYSIFEYGTDSNYSETLFRGAKIIIKDRSDYSGINYNVESLKCLPNPLYNGYKFSSVLTYINYGTKLTFIKNDKYKSVSLVIQSDLQDPVLLEYMKGGTAHSFIDRSLLYTLSHKLAYVPPNGPSAGYLEYKDINLSGQIYKWSTVENTGLDNTFNWTVYGRTDLNGSSPNYINELNFNENGNYNDIILGSELQSIRFKNITRPTASTFRCKDIELFNIGSTSGTYNLPTFSTIGAGPKNNLELLPWDPMLGFYDYIYPEGIPYSWTDVSVSYYDYPAIITQIPRYIGGGYNAYDSILESISFASISDQINSGNPDVRYINVDEDGVVSENQFLIEISKPDYPIKSTYLKYDVIKERLIDLVSSSKIIGYELTSKPRVELNQLSRYRGPYNPKWRDLVKFIDTDDIKGMTALNGSSLSYNNIQLMTSQPTFDDNNLFMLNNIYYNKVNTESPNFILRSSLTKNSSVYPLIDETAIYNKDIFLFKSNWDTNFYNKFLKSNIQTGIIGTREPKEIKSFFGSKVIAIPNMINLEKFPTGIIKKSSLGGLSKITRIPQNIVEEEIRFAKNQTLNVKIFTSLALQDQLILEGFGQDFYKYMNPAYSFGNPNQEDDIKTYISENILERYIIKEIVFWEKFWKKGNPLPNIEYSLTDAQKKAKGYNKTKNFQTIFNSPEDLDFQLIYNIPKDKNYSIAFSIMLEKK